MLVHSSAVGSHLLYLILVAVVVEDPRGKCLCNSGNTAERIQQALHCYLLLLLLLLSML